MKKQSLKKQVRKAQNAILNENQDWYDNLIKNEFPEDATKKGKKNSSRFKLFIISFSSLCVAVVALIIGLVVFLPSNSPTAPPTKHYMIENQRSAEIELAELNKCLTKIAVNIDSIYKKQITRIYDSESGDNLYYKLQIENEDVTYETIALSIYANPDYLNDNKLSKEIETTTLGKLTVNYNENIVNDDWAFVINYTAIVEYSNVTIYIKYSQLSLDQNSNFFNFIEQTIKAI